MTNPQLTKNLLEVIRSLPDQDRSWLLEQLCEDSFDLSSQELAERSRSEAGRGLKPWTRLTTPGFCIWMLSGFCMSNIWLKCPGLKLPECRQAFLQIGL
jgi:hypothetical protein